MKWYIPDCYWPEVDQGDYVSHEAVCVLNVHHEPAKVSLTLFFEDRDPMEGFAVTVPARRTSHIRLDKLKSADGRTIPRGTPYAMEIECDRELRVQYTRVDTTQPALALATTIV